MSEETPDVTLGTVHDDLVAGFADLKGEVRTGFADLKGEMREGFADLKGEMREGFAHLKGEMREGFADLKGEIREVKATLVAGFRGLASRESGEEMVRLLREGNRLHDERLTQLDIRIREQHLETQQVLRALVDGQRGLSVDIKALVARIDALIRGRSNGEPPP